MSEVGKLNIAICDDECHMRSRIRSLVQKQGMHCQVSEFSTGQALLKAIDETGESPDILFLGISTNGIDGMSIARKLRIRLRERQEPVWGSLPLLIFVTGDPKYMLEAFEVSAFQILVKPLEEPIFHKVFTQEAQ